MLGEPRRPTWNAARYGPPMSHHSLDQRIAGALSSDSAATSAMLAALYNEATSAITAAATAADQAKTRALDPTIADSSCRPGPT